MFGAWQEFMECLSCFFMGMIFYNIFINDLSQSKEK